IIQTCQSISERLIKKLIMYSQAQTTALIKKSATSLGFDYCGIARAKKLDEDARRLEQWLNKGMHGSMQYMENYFEMRVDHSRLVPGAKSVIILLKNYYHPEKQKDIT